MEKDSAELENLKQKLFRKSNQKSDEKLLKLPITAYRVILENIVEEKKRELEVNKKKPRSLKK
jgi:DNA gyrase inhibitor GyrI